MVCSRWHGGDPGSLRLLPSLRFSCCQCLLSEYCVPARQLGAGDAGWAWSSLRCWHTGGPLAAWTQAAGGAMVEGSAEVMGACYVGKEWRECLE